MLTFEPNRSLLNPKFEGYKLDPIDQQNVLSRFPLEHPVTQSSAAGRSPLSFQEVQSRIRHNHLAVGPGANGRAAYVDQESQVVLVQWDDIAQRPTFDVVYELPRVLKSQETDVPHREYPSAVFLDEQILFVSDGNDTMYALRLGQEGPTTLLNSYELKVPEEYRSLFKSVPFRIHQAVSTCSTSCIVLLSSRHYSNEPDNSEDGVQAKYKKPISKYDLWAVSIDLDAISQDQPIQLPIKWHRRGTDVPSYVSYIKEKNTFVLVGSTQYRALSSVVQPSYEPSPDEIAPIPRADEVLDIPPAGPQRPPPYSWTQSTDSVTVAFPIPSDTPKSAIKITMSPTTLSLFVQDPETEGIRNDAIALPRYALRKWWDGIRPTTSFWTFDREGEHAFGLLTLHLDKAHDGTRWSSLFAQTTHTDGRAHPEDDVPETLDPSELVRIRESLEKYTAALQSGSDASGMGLGRGVPSLAEGELDDEIDLDTGDMVCVTWVGVDGSTPAWAQEKGSDAPIAVLATPLPAAGGQQTVPSVVVKHGMDGLVFDVDVKPDNGPVEWTHTSTFCVLSFVLASKRDTRFVHHVSSQAVLAFESGARGMGSNIYIYRGVARRGDKWAKQAVLKAGDGSGGPLLGVGMIHTNNGKPILLCLCERELVAIQSIL